MPEQKHKVQWGKMVVGIPYGGGTAVVVSRGMHYQLAGYEVHKIAQYSANIRASFFGSSSPAISSSAKEN